MGKPMGPVVALLCGIVGKIVVSYVLTAIPSINILGSAFGTLVSYVIAAAIEYVYIKKSLKLQFNQMEFFIKPLLVVMLMFVAARLSYTGMAIFLNTKIATLIAISIGGLVYVFGILGFGGITQEEILAMPKGNKLLAKLKKYRLIRG